MPSSHYVIGPAGCDSSPTLLPGPFFSLLVKGPELGAQPSVYLAVAEELEGVTGRYYDVLMEKEPAQQALDPHASQRLWEASSRLVGLEAELGRTIPGLVPGPTTPLSGVMVD